MIRVRDLKPEWYFGGHGAPLSGIGTIQEELNSALDWLNTLEKFLLDGLREKSPQRTIDLTRGAWRKVYEKAGSSRIDDREARDPREYSIVSVNAMLLDLSRRGLLDSGQEVVASAGAHPGVRLHRCPCAGASVGAGLRQGLHLLPVLNILGAKRERTPHVRM